MKFRWWILIIIAGILLLGAGGYFGYVKYNDYSRAQFEKEKAAQELAQAQQQALEEARGGIEKGKQDLEALKEDVENQKAINKFEEEYDDLKEEYKSRYGDSNNITAYELNPYISGVVKIFCKNVEGSGSLWRTGDQYFVLTNAHVVESIFPNGSCSFIANDINENSEGVYYIYPNKNILSGDSDVAFIPIDSMAVPEYSKSIDSLNYKISSLPPCSEKMPQGANMIIIGYPAYAKKEYTIQGIQGVSNGRIVTEGLISGYSSILPTNHPDYYISAKIDSGNSGGIALSKDENGLCVLGIPTWLSVGNYETQGIVQNIHNVMYIK